HHAGGGSFGEFFGGIYGTIFTFISMVLVVITFYFQKKQTENSDTIQQNIANKAELAQEALAEKANEFQKQLTQMSIDQAELQRFNELFFELLNLYKSFVADLGEPDNTETQGCGCF
ncbi:MAG: hypothetical protein K2K97_06285, partial [Muribaculaceae bacterium]|nr:hypothetical protein [Muribaculaceae bacterium]